MTVFLPVVQVDEQQLNKQLEEIKAIIKMREKLNTKFPVRNADIYFLLTVSEQTSCCLLACHGGLIWSLKFNLDLLPYCYMVLQMTEDFQLIPRITFY